jgi:hypothetical protein
MTWVLDASGTQAAQVGVEHQLAQSAQNGTFQLYVDLSAMAIGDVVELRVYTKVLADGALGQAWKGVFSHQQVSPIPPSPPIASDVQVQVTLKQTAGTPRSFAWKILRI